MATQSVPQVELFFAEDFLLLRQTIITAMVSVTDNIVVDLMLSVT
jgi:hypothetical protein